MLFASNPQPPGIWSVRSPACRYRDEFSLKQNLSLGAYWAIQLEPADGLKAPVFEKLTVVDETVDSIVLVNPSASIR